MNAPSGKLIVGGSVIGLIAMGLLIVVLWHRSAARAVQIQIAAAGARGEPVLLSDFPKPSAIPDSENAAIEWRAAFAENPEETQDEIDRENDLPFLGEFPATADEIAALREHIAISEKAFPHVQAALQRPRVNWGVQPASGFETKRIPELNQAHLLSDRLHDHALISHLDGDDRKAVNDLLAIMRLSNDAQQITPDASTYFVGVGIAGNAVRTIEQLLPELQVDDKDHSTTRSQLEELLKELCDETGMRRGVDASMQLDRARLVATLAATPMKPGWSAIQNQGLADLMEWMGWLEQANAADSYPAAQVILAAHPPPADFSHRVPIVSSILAPSMKMLVDTEFRFHCDRRLAATAMAIKLDGCGSKRGPLQLNATNRWPATMCVDPYSANGQRFIYSGDDVHPRYIYSVAENGVDDGGSTAMILVQSGIPGQPARRLTDHTDRPFDRWERDDALFYLDHRARPATLPAE